MMTTPSIDLSLGMPSGVDAGLLESPALTPSTESMPTEVLSSRSFVAFATLSSNGTADAAQSWTVRDPSGLANLVAENASLGEALQAIVAQMDEPIALREEAIVVERPVVLEKSVVASDVAAPAVLVAETPVAPEAAVEPTAAPREEAIVVERPVVSEKSVVAPEVLVAETPVAPEATVEPTAAPREEAIVVERPVVSEKSVVAGLPRPQDDAVTDDGKTTDRPVSAAGEIQLQAVDATPVQADVPTVAASAAAAPEAPLTTDRVAQVEAVQNIVRASSASPVEELTSAANEVARVILVTPSLMQGEAGEIRIELKPNILEGSSVVVQVEAVQTDAPRSMAVTFIPASTPVADVIVANTQVVARTLAARVPDFTFAVSVEQTVATNVAVPSVADAPRVLPSAASESPVGVGDSAHVQAVIAARAAQAPSASTAAQVAESAYRAPIRKVSSRERT